MTKQVRNDIVTMTQPVRGISNLSDPDAWLGFM